MTPMALRLIALLVLATQSLSHTSNYQTVNIFHHIPSDVDQCIRPCLFRPDNANADVGSALNCGAPYRRECYCATDSDDMKAVSKHIDSCAQASCSNGQESQDAETMRHYYASYCMVHSYSEMEEWYTGTVATDTATPRDMWGWPGTGTRTSNILFPDTTRPSWARPRTSDVIPSATDPAPSDDEDNDGACLANFKLLYVGMPVLVALSQWI
ncbi:hypothetical protein J7337_001870 [Fusarium musae]|uniref:Extracellular membrane protein CFEM domain-containing protein n=1 Tax=Fusarium musae TaxID=1042133 RepID=A0A9P8DVD6_9HYPO|nr:hypothetical protein J7337_001870 [Fusarium musae]KAG9508306.1 hypothetical protein J7337_001870 [Fusarium musae]